MNVRHARTADALLSIQGLTCLFLNEVTDNGAPLNCVRVMEPFKNAMKAMIDPIIITQSLPRNHLSLPSFSVSLCLSPLPPYLSKHGKHIKFLNICYLGGCVAAGGVRER